MHHNSSDGSFGYATLNDPTVAAMLKQGDSLEAIIGQLVADKEKYIERLIHLEGIAPRKVSLPDGRVLVWRCPHNLIP